MGRLCSLALLAVLALGLASAQSAPLATFMVTNTNDSGDGSLRQAIIDANGATGADTITFDLVDPAEVVLSATELPTLTDTVTIDGSNVGAGSQVTIDGGALGNGANGISLGVGSDGSTIENLSIGSMPLGTGILIVSNSNTVRNTTIDDVADGIDLASGAADNTIGGSFSAGDGNTIRNYSGVGIELAEVGSGNKVQGNDVGRGVEDSRAGGGVGIGVFATDGTVIGAEAGPEDLGTPGLADFGNVVVATEVDGAPGISITGGSTGTVIAFNHVGVNRGGTSNNLGNRLSGIFVTGSSGTQIGPGNVVSQNGTSATGIHIESGSGNRIVANSIFDNIGLGIALEAGANGDINAPTVSSAVATGGGTATVSGSFPGNTGSYYVEFFKSSTCDASGFGEGQTYVGFTSATITEIGTSFSGETFGASVVAGDKITTTLTNAGTNDTSEFSNCVTVTAGPGGGSLSGNRAGPSSANLTSQGTADWAVWGYSSGGAQCAAPGTCSTSLAPDVRKSGGAGISNLQNIDPGPAIPLRGIGFVSPQPFTFGWSDGSPIASGANARTGLQHNGGPPTNASTLNRGFRFTVPADTTQRTVKVWVALNRAGGHFTATLSDGSAAGFADDYNVGTGDFIGAVYNLTYQAASAGQTLTVTWVENVDNCAAFRCDNVSIHAVALQGPGGPGGGNPPVLTNAVPDLDGSTLGVAGVWDSGSPTLGQSFDVTFYSGSTCATVTPFASSTELDLSLVTNERGIGAFAIDGLPNRPVGTFIAASVNGSARSNCVIADRSNVSWPTAFELPPDATDSANFLRTTGQARWFKVPVVANSRIDVTLKNLPADYDLVVFRDIQAKYDELLGGAPANEGPNLALTDLNRQGAETPVDLFNTSQYNPSSWEPTNWKPDLNANLGTPAFSPSEYSPSEYSSSFTSPSEYSPSEYSPSEYSPSEYSPSEYSPSEYSSDQFSRDLWATSNPADPRAFSAAQTASVVAMSSGAGTGDESVSVNTWNNTGFFYVRVQGKNGSFDADTPFSLKVSRTGNVCSGVSSEALDDAGPPIGTPGHQTLILYDLTPNRWPPGTNLSTLPSKLTQLAADTDGVTVNVGSDSVVAALNAQADSNAGCPFAKNLVAARIKQIVNAHRSSTLKYVVVVGGDNVIPFFRYADPALLGNERLYVPPVSDTTASQASLRLGYVLSDDFIASRTTVSTHGNELPVPDLAIGRLVETPGEIEGMIDAFRGASGSVSPTSSLVTGYGFLTDAADSISSVLAPKIPGANDETLITNQGISPGTVTVGDTPDRTHSWTAADLRRELLAQRHDVIFLAGHFSANDALAADYRTNVLTTELANTTTNLTNAIVFSAGCHAGYNIVFEHAVTGVTERLDWPQAFAQKKATLIAGTGYQYGDTDFLAHSERIYAEFARQLGGAVGTSLLRSKQLFLERTPGLSALDEKAFLETTLFGLPMLNVNLTPTGLGGGPSGLSPTPVGGGPGLDLGLTATAISVAGPSGSPTPKTLNGLGSDNPATWFDGPDGVAVKPMQPVLPLDSVNVSVAGTSLRGVGFRGGTYNDTFGAVPLTAAPADEVRGIHAPFFTDVFFPQQPWNANYFGALSGSGNTQLHVTPVQHRSDSPKMTRRKFSNMNFKLFYSANTASFCGNRDNLAPCDAGQIAATPALAAPPTITGVDTSFSSGVLTFSAHVIGDSIAGIQEVWVTWTNPPEASGGLGTWAPLDLVRDTADPTLWKANLTLPSGTNPSDLYFMVHASNGVGRVTTDDNVGALYRPGFIPGPIGPGEAAPAGTTLSFVSAPPGSVRYGATFPVTVHLNGSGDCNSVANKRVRVGLGGAGLLSPPTAANGNTTVTVNASLSPGTYLLTASFEGDATCASSDVSADVVVTQQPTALALAFPAATLTATTSPPTPLHQRNVTWVIRKTGVTRIYTGKTDPQGRVELPQSLLQSLPAGTYTVDVFFNGVNVPGVIQLAPDDVDYGHSEAHATRELFPFTGFLGLQNPPAFNTAKGGTSLPVKFSLGSNRGLGIFAAAYPKFGRISCTTGNPLEPLQAAENTGFRYDTANRHYTYDWKTTKSWTGCRQLVLRFTDGTERILWFRF